MKKRVLTAILALVIAASLPVMAIASSWAGDMMAELVERKIMDAIPGDPDEYITREDYCVMLAKAAVWRSGAALPSGDASVFADADAIKPESVPFLMYLHGLGILQGSLVEGKVYMLPDSLVTRQDAMALLGRWLELHPAAPVSKTSVFTDDETISDYARSIVYQLFEMNVVTGYPDGSYMPRQNISHAETASLIYKTLTGNILRTYFGDGNLGNENGDSLAAKFSVPYGVCIDDDGNLIVFDTYNACVKLIKDGVSTTILGFSDVLDDYDFAMPYYLDGAQKTALFGRPVDGVCGLNGDLFIVDRENHAIRLLRDGTVYTFVGGEQGFADGRKGTAKFDSPSAIAMDKAGNLYVADTMNHCIRKVTQDGTVTTIAGTHGKNGYADGGTGAALFNEPSGIAVDGNGALYVADTGNHVIRKIDGGNVTTVAGTVSAVEEDEDYAPGGVLNFPRGLCWAENKLFIADSGNHEVKVLKQDGKLETIAGGGEPGDKDGAQSGETMLQSPTSVAYGEGVLYIADSLNNKIKTVWLDK